MSHAFVKNHIPYLVFSTKDRQPSISKDVQPELWSYLAGICRNQKMAAIAINGMSASLIFFFTCRQLLRWPMPFGFSKRILPNG